MHRRQPLAKAFAGIGVLVGQRQQISVVGDDVGSGARDCQFDEAFVVGVPLVSEAGADRTYNVCKIAQTLDHEFDDLGRDCGVLVGQFIPPENFPVLAKNGTAEEQPGFPGIAQTHESPRSGIAVGKSPHQDIGIYDKFALRRKCQGYRRGCEDPLRRRAALAAFTRRSSSSPLTPASASRKGAASSSSEVVRAFALTAKSFSISWRRYSSGVNPSACARRRTAETFVAGSFAVRKVIVADIFDPSPLKPRKGRVKS